MTATRPQGAPERAGSTAATTGVAPHTPAPTTGAPADADSALLTLGYRPTLRRRLGLGAVLVHGLLFFVPMAPVAVFGIVVDRSGGTPLAVYLVAAVVMGLSAISYREMALRFPVAGSVYGYTRLATNRALGFVAGWLILLDYLLMPALLTILSALALEHVVTTVPAVAFSVLFVGASLLLNLRGTEITARAGLVLLAVQLVVVAIFVGYVLAAIAHGTVRPGLDGLWHAGASPGAVLAAVPVAALSYLGFDAVATLNEEARGGGRTVARATTVLLVAVTAVFLVQLWAAHVVTHATSFPAGEHTDRAFYDAVDAVTPGWFTPVFTLTNAFVAIFACLVVAHASSARLVFAMARDRLLPASLARTTRRGVPHVATLAVAAVTLVLAVVLAHSAETMTRLVTFGALSSYVLLHVAVVVRCLVVERSRRWVTHLVVPVLGVAGLVLSLARTTATTLAVGLGWLAVGVLVLAAGALLRRRS